MESLFILTEKRVAEVLDKWESLRFPQLLRKIRESYGQSKTSVSKDTGIGYYRLFQLEKGNYTYSVTSAEIKALCAYYMLNEYAFTMKVGEFEALRRDLLP